MNGAAGEKAPDINVPDLIKIGIIHYQFETIHPFLDGNGRVGRLLVTLYLINKGMMDKPLLYFSKYFEHNKQVYYDNLMRVRNNNDMVHWLRYFLIGIRDTAIEAADTLAKVLELKNDIEVKIRELWGRRTHSALNLLEHLFKSPVVQIKDVQKICSLSAKASGDLVQSFENAGYLREITGQQRNRIYLFRPYLDKFKT